jgi:hypothetical protein
MRRVLFVHPFSTDRLGGAEQSLRRHIAGAPPGVRITVIGPEQECKLGRYDAVVLGNLRPPGGLGMEAELQWLLRWAVRLDGYDGFALRSERDVHPCTHRDGRCIVGQRLKKSTCDCTSAMRDANELLYNACSAVQFLSPAHQRVINQLIRISVPQYVIASPIDFSEFRITTPVDQRPPKALILGDAIRVAPTAIDRARSHGFEPETVPYLSIPFDQMPALYNRYRAVVVDPLMFHAFGRIAIEAMACGCRVLASERVGAMSWPDPVWASRHANEQFWRVLAEGCAARRPLPWYRSLRCRAA